MYLVKINDFIAQENGMEYSFLYEMFPEIKELYQRLWFYQNIADISEKNKEEIVTKLQYKIYKLLKMNRIPDSILLEHRRADIYIEPISGYEFNLHGNVKLKEAIDKYTKFYFKKHKNNKFFFDTLTEFKNITEAKQKRR